MRFEDEIRAIIEGTNVLVTGGTGSIGSEIVRQLLPYNPHSIRVFSNSENELYEMRERMGKDVVIRYILGDIRSKNSLRSAMRGVGIVFHAAALKHVPMCEYNPLEAVSVNIIGTANVFEVAIDAGVKRMVNISTDKAVNPEPTMGACKLVGERIIRASREFTPSMIACNVRFGNVLGSRGSIVPKVLDYLQRGKSIGITDERMTRFVMTISDAARLVIRAAAMSLGSETFIFKMARVRIKDLIRCAALYFSDRQEFGIEIGDFLAGRDGRRQGEKLSESLLTEGESEIAVETDDMIIVPAPISMLGRKYEIHPMFAIRPLATPHYESGDGPFLDDFEIRELLEKAGI